MYCQSCHELIPGDADRCPFCGANVKHPKKKKPNKLLRILLGIGAWFAAMLGIAIVGSVLKLDKAQGILSTIYSLSVVVLPLVLAFKVAIPKGTIKRNPPAPKVQQTPKAQPTAKANATMPQQTPRPSPSVEPKPKPVAVPKSAAEPTPQAASTPKIENKPKFVGKTHKATGMEHYMDAIMRMAITNYDYDLSKKALIDDNQIGEKVWKYIFCPRKTELVPEPDNPYNPKAIKVVVDGHHVAYIKDGSCAHLLKLINSDGISHIVCEMGGGPYKIIYEEYDDEKDRDDYYLERGSSRYFVHLTVYERTP